MHEGRSGKRLDRHAAEREAVADLAERLALGRGVVRAGRVDQSRKVDEARGADAVPGHRGAGTEVPRPVAGARINAETGGLDIGEACTRTHANARIGVAADRAHHPIAEALIEASEEAAEVT